LTSQTIWDLPACPAHLVILGAGPMGCELAEAFAGLGAKVTLIGPMLPREDAEMVAILGAHLRARGVNLLAPRAVAAAPGIGVLLADGNTVTGSHLLIAAGRRAETTALNLAAAGIQAGRDGIRTDAGLRALGTRHIYAAGDCADPAGIGPQRFTHVAGSHAGIVLRRALFRLPAKLNPAPPVRAVFTAPELAQVGFTAAEAGPGGRALTGRFADNDRAVADDDITGMVKLVLDRRGRLIGAGIVGRHAGEMIGLYALAIASRTRLSALAGLVLPYPTLSESGKRAIGGYLGERLFSKGPRFVAKWLGRLP